MKFNMSRATSSRLVWARYNNKLVRLRMLTQQVHIWNSAWLGKVGTVTAIHGRTTGCYLFCFVLSVISSCRYDQVYKISHHSSRNSRNEGVHCSLVTNLVEHMWMLKGNNTFDCHILICYNGVNYLSPRTLWIPISVWSVWIISFLCLNCYIITLCVRKYRVIRLRLFMWYRNT